MKSPLLKILPPLAILFILTALPAYSKMQFSYENMQVFNLTLEDGLSQGTVNCILRDRYGLMWFGTLDGLNRYNGYNFRIFRHRQNDERSLSCNQILCLLETSGGQLWIGTSGGGVCFFDFLTEQFTTIALDSSAERNGGNAVYALAEAPDRSIWAGTADGLYRLDQDNLTVKSSFHHNPADSGSLSSDFIFDLLIDHRGNLWIASAAGGLNLYLPDSARFERFLPLELKPGEEDQLAISALCKAGEDDIWAGTHSAGLMKFNLTERTLICQPLKYPVNDLFHRDYITALLSARNGCLWIGTMPDGLLRLEHGQVRPFQPSMISKATLTQWGINSIYEDDTGAIWIGTNGYGLYIITNLAKKFNTMRYDPGEPYGLNMQSVRAIMQDFKGALWVGGYGMLDRIDMKTGKITPSQFSNAKNPLSKMLNNSNIYCLLPDPEDPKNTLWVGTEGFGLSKYSYDTQLYQQLPYINLPSQENALLGGNVFEIVPDSRHNLWIATQIGLNRLEKKTGRFTHYRNDPVNPRSLPPGRIKALYIDKQGTIWAGSDRAGIARLDDESGIFTRFTYRLHDETSLGADGIHCFFEDAKNRFWIGTNGGGLNLMNRQTGAFISYTIDDGLPNDVVYGILEDKEGNLWLSTNFGLCKFNPDLLICENYDVEDGLQCNEFNNGAYYQNSDSVMFFGGVKGVSYFHPDSLITNPYLPPVIVTGFRIFNTPVNLTDRNYGRKLLDKPVYMTDEIVLSHRDYALSFDFAALNFIAPEKNEYAYMLQGFEDDWNYCGRRRYANYTNLPPGEYTFRVKASNNDGLWNEQGAFLRLVITPPLWKVWWFRLIAVSAVLGAVFAWHRWRMADIETKKRRLEDLVGERTVELKESNQKLSYEVEIRKRIESELRQTNTDLQQALTEVKTLSGLLPICSSCKKIRDDQGYWTQVETYIAKHAEVEFSHGICPDCMQKLYPEFYDNDKKE